MDQEKDIMALKLKSTKLFRTGNVHNGQGTGRRNRSKDIDIFLVSCLTNTKIDPPGSGQAW